MRYNGNGNSNERVGLVGKGLTFDTGGYSLKPSSSMDTMKSDMGGAKRCYWNNASTCKK